MCRSFSVGAWCDNETYMDSTIVWTIVLRISGSVGLERTVPAKKRIIHIQNNWTDQPYSVPRRCGKTAAARQYFRDTKHEWPGWIQSFLMFSTSILQLRYEVSPSILKRIKQSKRKAEKLWCKLQLDVHPKLYKATRDKHKYPRGTTAALPTSYWRQ